MSKAPPSKLADRFPVLPSASAAWRFSESRAPSRMVGLEHYAHVDNVLTAELRLPAELLESPDQGEPADDVEEAWSDEIQRRLAEVDAGTVTPVP